MPVPLPDRCRARPVGAAVLHARRERDKHPLPPRVAGIRPASRRSALRGAADPLRGSPV